jgi:hypothetical protein
MLAMEPAKRAFISTGMLQKATSPKKVISWKSVKASTAEVGEGVNAASARKSEEAAIATAGIPFLAQVALTPLFIS